MHFKKLIAIALSVTMVLSNINYVSFADGTENIESSSQDASSSNPEGSQNGNDGSSPQDTSSANSEDRQKDTTESHTKDDNVFEKIEENKKGNIDPINFTAEFEKLEKNSKGGYLDYVKATKLAVQSIETGAKDHVILEDMGINGDKNYYWFNYKTLDQVLPNIKRKYFDSSSAEAIIKKIEEFVLQNGPNETEEKIKELISQNNNDSSNPFNFALFSTIGATIGYGIDSLFNFVKNTFFEANDSYTSKEQEDPKNIINNKKKRNKNIAYKKHNKKSSGLIKLIGVVLGALSGVIYQSRRQSALERAIRKNAEDRVKGDKKAEFEKLYKELFNSDLKNAACYDMLMKILDSVDEPPSPIFTRIKFNDYRNEYFTGKKHSCMGIKFDGPSRAVSFQGAPINLDDIDRDTVNQNFDRLIKEIKLFRGDIPLNKKKSWEKSLGIN